MIYSDLRELVKTTMQKTISAMLDEEADDLVGAEHYKRKLTTTSGEIELSVPKLWGMRFETAVIERYRAARPLSRRP